MERALINNVFKKTIISALNALNIDYRKAAERISKSSVGMSVRENGWGELVDKLRVIEPDISNQEEGEKELFNDYWELKRRALQAFQCKLTLKALEDITKKNVTVVDIGDSAGTHMLYLKELTKDKFCMDTIGVNLDPRAIEKIKTRGQKAILCRAEELDLGNKSIDLFTSFEMVEHLHNPAIFFNRLAKRPGYERLVITVPYLRQSRVGLYHTRSPSSRIIYAKDEHIFELSPHDWKLLILHSGWKVVYDRIYYQYPKKIPVIAGLLGLFWRNSDFEGFWGAIMEKDASACDRYKDWE